MVSQHSFTMSSLDDIAEPKIRHVKKEVNRSEKRKAKSAKEKRKSARKAKREIFHERARRATEWEGDEVYIYSFSGTESADGDEEVHYLIEGVTIIDDPRWNVWLVDENDHRKVVSRVVVKPYVMGAMLYHGEHCPCEDCRKSEQE